MKKSLWLWLSGTFMLVSVGMQAQTYAETALLFSRIRTGGSARIQSMGGAQVSLGGDYSSAYSNPAGLGFFNRSEFTVTPAINISTTSSDFYRGNIPISSGNNDSRSNLNIPGLSIVFHNDFSDKSNSVINGNFSISLNRVNDFNQNFNYQGLNPNTSRIDFFVNDAQGLDISQFGKTGYSYNHPTGLAYDNFLIGPYSILNPNDSLYIQNITNIQKINNDPNNPNPNETYFTDARQVPFQNESVKTTGAQNQINLAYGINLKDRFYFGAGLGITSLRYSYSKKYSETFTGGPLNRFDLTETLSVSGSGINLTIGTIIKPIEIVQLGLSLATPSWYTVSDNYQASLSSTWNNYKYFTSPNDPTQFVTLNKIDPQTTDEVLVNYSLNTPWRLNAGATFLIKKHGLITFEVEHLNYGKTSYNSATDGFSFDGDNQEIQSSYKSTFNFRGGGEYRLNNLRFRLGYNFMGDPYQSTRGGDRSISSFSGGAGYRTKTFYLDLTAISIIGNTLYSPYSYGIPTAVAPVVKTANNNLQVMVTLGFPF